VDAGMLGTGLAAAAALAASGWAVLAQRGAAAARARASEAEMAMRALEAGLAPLGAVTFGWDAGPGHGLGGAAVVGRSPDRHALAARLDLPFDADAAALLAALDARTAGALGPAVDALRREGAAFRLSCRDLALIGGPAGDRAAVTVVPDVEHAAPRVAADDAPVPIWRTDAAGRLTAANAAYAVAVEAADPADAIARDLALDAQAVADCARAATGATLIATRAMPVEGALRTLRLIMFPHDGGARGIAFDITDEAGAAEALASQMQSNAETLSLMTDAVAVFGPDRRLVLRNAAFERLWDLDAAWCDEGPTQGEWLDRLRERARLPHQADFAGFKAAELALFQQADAIPDALWTLPDGRTLRVARLRQPSGGLLVLFEDITDGLSLQARYTQLIEVQRATLDALSDSVAVFGLDGRLKLSNRAFAASWRLERDRLEAGPTIEDLRLACAELVADEAFWADLAARIGDTDPARRREASGDVDRLDGAHLRWVARPLPDGAMLLAFTDVTAVRKVESALRDRAVAYQAADVIKTEFVRNVSYQLRTPLTTIQGYGDLLASGAAGALDDRQARQVAAIRRATEQLHEMIDNILDLALIDAGKMELDLGDVHVGDLLTDTAAMARSQVSDAGVSLDVRAEPGVVIRADAKRVRQMLFTVTTHAMGRVAGGGAVTFEARTFQGEAILSITDTGPTLSPERQIHAFDGFSSDDRRGSGVGLALVRKFCEMHGGWAGLRTPPAGGLTIECHLPLEASPRHARPELNLEPA
jgi:signal transduction histidine kinase